MSAPNYYKVVQTSTNTPFNTVSADVSSSQFIYVDLEYTNNSYQNPIYDSSFGNNGLDTYALVDSLSRAVPFVSKASDYKFAIESFSFPESSLPLFIFDNKLVRGQNYNRFYLSAQLTVGSTTYGPFHDYIFSQDPATGPFEIYGYITFTRDLNRIFASLQDQIVTAYDDINGPGSYAANAELPQLVPFCQYSETEDRFNFYADPKQANNYADYTNPSASSIPIEWIFSNNLYQLYRGNYFEDAYITGTVDVNFSKLLKIVWDIKPGLTNMAKLYGNVNDYMANTNLNTYVVNSGQSPVNGEWGKFTKLVIVSNHMCLRKTNTNAAIKYDINESNLGKYVQDNTVLTYTLTTDGSFNKNKRYVYNAVYLRWCDLYDSNSLNRIDLNFGVFDTLGNFYRLKLISGERISVRCVISKKFFA